MQLHDSYGEVTYGYQWDRVIFYLVALKTPLQMLYSHLNPLIFVILLKPLGDLHSAILAKTATLLIVDVEAKPEKR